MVERALRDWLLGDPYLVATIGQRIFPQIAPQGTPAPFGVYMRVSTVREATQSAAAQLPECRFQFDWYADGNDAVKAYEQVKELAKRARLRLDAFMGLQSGVWIQRIFLDGEYDDIEQLVEGGERYRRRVTQDYIVHFEE